jgi:hypothetical protein
MIIARKLCLQLWVQPRQRSLYVIRSQVVFPTFTCRRKKDHSSRRFLLILGMGALLSAVSAGVAVSAVILYHLGIIFGVFLPCKPVKKSFGIADRVRGSPLVLYGSGTFWGGFYRSCSCLFTGLRSRRKIWSILPLTVCKRRYSSRFAR